jgi:coenzyme F420-0:L-glutamate ligase / coenzyme F420-1:gamma-L-glutamate ligase
VLQELERMNGDMKGWCPEAILTELKPEGMKEGSILIANAGLDESNVEKGQCIGWPKDPVRSVKQLKKDIEKSIGGDIAIILSDSCVRPGRMGVTACALCVSGIDPIHAQKGKHDLFGKPLRITMEAVADQLATAANVLMGNADQSIPFVLIRDHTVPFTSYSGWVSGIRVEEDIFAPLYT